MNSNDSAWMSNNISDVGNKTLREICMPGTHDAGMGVFTSGTPFASPCNTVTQKKLVAGQLQLGSRYFDIRPVVSGGKFFTGHYTEIDAGLITSWQGANGQSIESVINDINEYTKENAELIILHLSHDLDTDVGNSKYSPFSQEQWGDLLSYMKSNIAHLKSVAGDDLTKLTLNDYISDGNAAVIIVVEPSGENIKIDEFIGKGFYPATRFPVYNSYSDTNDLDAMIKDQLEKMRKEKTSPESSYFLLSWTLTQSASQVTTCATGLGKSILDLAGDANAALNENLLPACDKNCFPNIVYIDAINDESNVIDLVMKINNGQETETESSEIKPQEINFTTEDGTVLPALLGYVKGSKPGRLIIFCHGHTENMHVFDKYIPEFTDVNTMTLAVTYRNDDKFPVLAGAKDVIYASTAILKDYPSVEKIYLYSASMGGAIAGTAIGESKHYTLPGNKRFEYWVSASGVTNLIELYAEAALFVPGTREEIEEDAGGTPVEKNQEYVRRSPALRAEDLKAAGLKHVEVIHAKYDGIVLYNQAEELVSALEKNNVDVELTTLKCFKGDGSAGATIYSDVLLPDNVACLLSGCSISSEKVAGHVNTGDINNPSSSAGREALKKLLLA
ncbi:MAG: prolyl oligopeptidase family serine peptidase [Enterobacterales bacterium endosymbiont of Blomia tropicalis]|uniref:prolyl oligopeptidase family serine peptidase n=1 Tax=Mixta mediterraneensis TaxID=2758443 RepID=UPI0025A92DEF|nr:prolyl oligopeptidase family serine peptidase [Mixta mediterraneensis]MDL4912985.1 prolyl oligopeptidase family serine peptidase [Mixta mediterraneensis]